MDQKFQLVGIYPHPWVGVLIKGTLDPQSSV